MSVSVEISDRLYDYTDEERAANTIAAFQDELGLSDAEILALWQDQMDPRRLRLEKLILDAVDANGTVKRALESVPCEIDLYVEKTDV